MMVLLLQVSLFSSNAVAARPETVVPNDPARAPARFDDVHTLEEAIVYIADRHAMNLLVPDMAVMRDRKVEIIPTRPMTQADEWEAFELLMVTNGFDVSVRGEAVTLTPSRKRTRAR